MSWTSQLQKATALSTTEAKIIAANEEAKELVWLKWLVLELLSDFARKTWILYIGNTSAIELTKNPEYQKRSKHIEVWQFCVRERCLDDDIGLEHIDRRKELADLLTKLIKNVQFEILYCEIVITPGEQLSDLHNARCVTVFWRKR